MGNRFGSNPNDDIQFRAMAKMGYGPAAIGAEFGKSVPWAKRYAEENGIEMVTGRNAVPNIRALVDDMSPLDATNFLLEFVEACFPTVGELRIAPFVRLGFARTEANLLASLLEAPDHTMSKDRVYGLNLFYAKDVTQLPEKKSVDALINRTRSRMASLRWATKIESSAEGFLTLVVSEQDTLPV